MRMVLLQKYHVKNDVCHKKSRFNVGRFVVCFLCEWEMSDVEADLFRM